MTLEQRIAQILNEAEIPAEVGGSTGARYVDSIDRDSVVSVSIPHIDYDEDEDGIVYLESVCEQIEQALRDNRLLVEQGEGLTDETAHVVDYIVRPYPTIYYRDDMMTESRSDHATLADAEGDATDEYFLNLSEQGMSEYQLHSCEYIVCECEDDYDCAACEYDDDCYRTGCDIEGCLAAQMKCQASLCQTQYLDRVYGESEDDTESIAPTTTCLYVRLTRYADVPQCDCSQHPDASEDCTDGICDHPGMDEKAHVWGDTFGQRGGPGLDYSWSDICQVCGIGRQTANLQVPSQRDQTLRMDYSIYYHQDGELMEEYA